MPQFLRIAALTPKQNQLIIAFLRKSSIAFIICLFFIMNTSCVEVKTIPKEASLPSDGEEKDPMPSEPSDGSDEEIDPNKVTVKISTTEGSLELKESPIRLLITFSKEIQDFGINDLKVTNGKILQLKGSRSIYYASLAPSIEGDVVISIAENASLLNSNSQPIQVNPISITLIYDHTPPSFSLNDASLFTIDRVNRSLSFSVMWLEGIDKHSSLVAYQLLQYTQPNCQGEATAYEPNSELKIDVAGTEEGVTYSFNVIAIDAAGNQVKSPCSNKVAVDLTPPEPPQNLIIAKNLSSAVHSNFDNDTEVVLNWNSAIDAQSEISSYTVHLYNQENCNGFETNINNISKQTPFQGIHYI